MIQNMAQQVNIGEDKELTRGQRLWLELVQRRRTEPVSLERAKLLTASWKETEGLPIPIRRAKAFEKAMAEIPIFIHEEQLLAGNYGSRPMAAEWRCETTVEWVLKHFEAEVGMMKIEPEDIPVMKEIAEYWKDKAIDSCFFRYIGPEEEKRYRKLDYLETLVRHLYHESLHGQGWVVPTTPRSSGKDCWDCWKRWKRRSKPRRCSMMRPAIRESSWRRSRS